MELLKELFAILGDNVEEVIERLQATEIRRDQVKQVSTKTPYPSPGRGRRVVLVDFGMKHGILRELNQRDCDVIVVPYNTTAEEILQLSPDGVMLSNGPGDPKDVPEAIQMIQGILGKVPLFGICLRTSIICTCMWCGYRKNEIWSSRFQSPGKGFM